MSSKRTKSEVALLSDARNWLHQEIVRTGVLSIDKNGVASNSDKDNTPSCKIGAMIAQSLNANVRARLPAQKVGNEFEKLVCMFLKKTFPLLQHLRPGDWRITNLGNKNAIKTSSFVQYEHLAHLANVLRADRQLATMLGNDYVVAPDIVVSRIPCDDDIINDPLAIVDDDVSLKADLRKSNNSLEIMHASISAKWTMRSDRAQNSRTEALNLIRNRKGRVPHIIVVTGEPLPSRLSSLALGTGDIDCMYHFALYELIEAVHAYGKKDREDIVETLDAMVDGKRLKDITDLPLDLAC